MRIRRRYTNCRQGSKKAQAFAASPDLREAMDRAGVIDKPDVYFLS
jgi:hypothetical protein